MTKIKRALISCTDKTGVVEFAKFLASQDVEILSTGGTAKLLQDNHIPVQEVSDFTGFPEMLDGRVKTLHPKIYGGILNIRENAEHQKQMQENQLVPIDLVVVNLYAFENTVAKKDCTLEDAIENIDIGGPSMLRASAKNYKDVIVVIDPNDYAFIQEQIQKNGSLTEEQRFQLAAKVFTKTAQYDTAIQNFLNTQSQSSDDSSRFPDALQMNFQKVQDLRYGENPHQKAAFYKDSSPLSNAITQAKQLQGKELSFNNILDTDAAYACCCEFSDPACVIVKHTNPCGVGIADTLEQAFINARSTDPVSSFGGIIAINRQIDEGTARIMAETFFEVIIAPSFSDQAKEIFAKKKNLRLMEHSGFGQSQSLDVNYRRVSGGILIQDADQAQIDLSTCEVPTKRKPSPQELKDLAFSWNVVKHVKSNAIVFAKDSTTLGIGAGQMSRVDSVKLAQMKCQQAFETLDVLQGSVLASDAFFPFRDGIDAAAKAGVKAIVQPGGSVRDSEVIEAADEYDIAMVFTKMRHFKH